MIINFGKIERKWRKFWLKNKIYEPDLKKAKKPFYNLMMFPYPSAEGLHVGNVYAFVGSDIYGRFKRMQGYDVFEPIGLDGFGIHSENYALKIGVHPAKQAKISEKNFYRQLQIIGNGFAWDERLETYDPEYYRWTQWIFVQMFKRGLAYRKKSPVNWCLSCKTVLADEQVIHGKCERCSGKVVKKELEQWFFRITKYAEKLLRNLEKIDWSEKVKIAQKEWIGKSEGAEIEFRIKNSEYKIKIFTTRPDTLFGVTYIVLAPEHKLLQNNELRIRNYEEVRKYIARAKRKTEEERITEKKEKTGIELKGVKAINPANQKEIPVWVADYVLSSYGTGAIMAVPAHDKRDFEFAKKFKLPIIRVISELRTLDVLRNFGGGHHKSLNLIRALDIPKAEEVYEDKGILINSGKFSGIDSEIAKWEITKFVGGKKQIQYHLRDWLISRQRYWGPPIPMIFCEACAKKKKGERKEMPGWYSVAENKLPVKLPFIKDFQPKGKGVSPLASVKTFYEVKCPKCGKKARRETDVSDTFLDSAWYYIGYLLLAKNSKYKMSQSRINLLLDKQNSKFQVLTRRWLPVNMYIGGAEHSVLHLLYSRFLAMVFYDLGLIHFDEPFSKFRAHGLLINEGVKMSKSKGNIIIPDNYIKKFGADVLRMYLMFLAPFEQGGDFRDAGILGIKRFLERVWRLVLMTSDVDSRIRTSETQKLERLLHQTIKKVTEDIENLRYNTAISALMILFNNIEKNWQSFNLSIFQSFLKLLAPFAPYLTEELWHRIRANPLLKNIDNPRQSISIHLEPWPKYNPNLIKEKEFDLVIQINGKVRDKVSVPVGISQKEVEKIVLSREKIKGAIASQKIKKIVFVPNRLINIVF